MSRLQNPARQLQRIYAILNRAAEARAEEGHWSIEALLRHSRERLAEAAKLLALAGHSRLRKEELAGHLLPALRDLTQRVAAATAESAGSNGQSARPGQGAAPARGAAARPGSHTSSASAAIADTVVSKGAAARPGQGAAPAQGAAARSGSHTSLASAAIADTAVSKGAAARPGQGAAPARGAAARPGSHTSLAASGAVEVEEVFEETIAATKFDLGPGVKEGHESHIPWGYAHDRITAMAIDPDRLFCYWEVTDHAIATARDQLGAGGPTAWLNLRIYDVSGRIFDGTNAHSYFDIRVERDHRQWFLTLNKPTSTQVVEVGLKSYEGYFVRIARSHRIDMPRKGPASGAPISWLTVRPESGAVEGVASPQSATGGGGGAGGMGPGEVPQAAVHATEGATGGPLVWFAPASSVHYCEVASHTWLSRSERFEWTGPIMRTSWQAGPFPLEVEAPGRIEERFEGTTTVYADASGGRVVYGPWEVVIHGLAGWAEGRVVGHWQVYKSWPAESGREVWSADGRSLGAGDDLLATGSATSPAGASERRWGAGSEQRLGGASELYRLGASEQRFGGASELRWTSGSEVRLAGGSEQVWGGGSEFSYLGGSERIHLGKGAAAVASAGASEQLGGSETRLAADSGEGRWPATA